MQEIFISYAWEEQSEFIVEKIKEKFNNENIKIIFDKNSIKYKESIRNFMRQIGKGKFVILIISAKYLSSQYCMFELLEVAKNKNFHDRIFPIVLSDSKIHTSIDRLKYIAFWEGKIKELDSAIKKVGGSNLQGIREDIDLFHEIRSAIAKFIDVISDMNTCTPALNKNSLLEIESVISEIYSKIIIENQKKIPEKTGNETYLLCSLGDSSSMVSNYIHKSDLTNNIKNLKIYQILYTDSNLPLQFKISENFILPKNKIKLPYADLYSSVTNEDILEDIFEFKPEICIFLLVNNDYQFNDYIALCSFARKHNSQIVTILVDNKINDTKLDILTRNNKYLYHTDTLCYINLYEVNFIKKKFNLFEFTNKLNSITYNLVYSLTIISSREHGYVNIDEEDIRNTLKGGDYCFFEVVKSSGTNRALEATNIVLESVFNNFPHLTFGEVNSLLLYIESGKIEVRMEEIFTITENLQNSFNESINLIWGNSHNDNIKDDSIHIIVIGSYNLKPKMRHDDSENGTTYEWSLT